MMNSPKNTYSTLILFLILLILSCSVKKTEQQEKLSVKPKEAAVSKVEKKKPNERRVRKKKKGDQRASRPKSDKLRRMPRNRNRVQPIGKEAMYATFADIPHDIPLAAMVKEDVAPGYIFTLNGKQKVITYKFGDTFSVLLGADSLVQANIDSLRTWVPLQNENTQIVWIKTEKLLINELAVIPTADTLRFYKEPTDSIPHYSFIRDPATLQVAQIQEAQTNASGNIMYRTRLIYHGYEKGPRKWSSEWISSESVKPWLDEIVALAAKRFAGNGGSGDWKFTPGYDRSYWRSTSIKYGSILFDKLISKYKPTLSDTATASKYLNEYSSLHFIKASLLEREDEFGQAYDVLDSFAYEAEGYIDSSSSARINHDWSLAAGGARRRAAKIAFKNWDKQSGLQQLALNIAKHADVPDKGYERNTTIGISSIRTAISQVGSKKLSKEDIAAFCENIPSLTKSPAVNALALLIRAQIADENGQFDKADSSHVQIMESYPADGHYFFMTYMKWSHSAFHRWSLAPIIRSGDYSEARRRLSGKVYAFSEEFDAMELLLHCVLSVVEDNKEREQWERCIALGEDKSLAINFHPSEYREFQEGFHVQRWLEPHLSIKTKDINRKQPKERRLSTKDTQKVYKLPFVPTDEVLSPMDTVKVSMGRIPGVFPGRWWKVQLSDSTMGWVKFKNNHDHTIHYLSEKRNTN